MVSDPILSSRTHIPATFHDLMTNESSPIIDFYPSTFQIDMNGKRMAWQGVVLLPFIDEKRLLEAMDPQYPNLTDEEKRRNQWGHNLLFVYEDHPLYATVEALYGKRKKDEASVCVYVICLPVANPLHSPYQSTRN